MRRGGRARGPQDCPARLGHVYTCDGRCGGADAQSLGPARHSPWPSCRPPPWPGGTSGTGLLAPERVRQTLPRPFPRVHGLQRGWSQAECLQYLGDHVCHFHLRPMDPMSSIRLNTRTTNKPFESAPPRPYPLLPPPPPPRHSRPRGEGEGGGVT